MITLTARIDLISRNNGTLGGITTNLSKNNISGEIGAVLGVKKQVENPFIFGASVFGDGSMFCDSVDYYIGDVSSNESGFFETPYVFTISGNQINSITLAFDTANDRHPNTISVDGVVYNDDDAIFTMQLEKADIHTITIDNWNSPNFPLVLSGVYINISINVDNRSLIALSREIFDRSDYKLPSYGIISNVGELEFNDLNGEIRDYAEQMLLTSDLKVYIYLNNTLSKTTKQIAEMETRDWDYDNDNRSVSVSLKDDLEEWQDIYVETIDYDPRNPNQVLENGTMKDLYNWLQHWSKTPVKYNMLTFNQLSETTQNILKNTKIIYPVLESGTLWQQWQKLCEVCGLYIYKNNVGNQIKI